MSATVGRMEEWRWPARIAVPLFAAVLVSATFFSPTLAVTRRDARRDAYVDVWTSSKNRVVIDGARDRVRFKLVARLSNDWALAVYLDTRGDEDADLRLRHFERFGHGRCDLRRLPNGDPHDVPCGRRWVNDSLLARLWWSVPRPRLSSDGGIIRWRVRTHDVGFDPKRRHDDRAPDVGWFP